MQQAALDVPSMDSRDCERAVTTALINEPGVFWATADAAAGLASVRYDRDRTNLEVLRRAVEAAGYEHLPRVTE